MIDPNNREVLTKIYRLVEKYETPPRCKFTDDAEEYFSEALKELKQVIDEFPGNDFARCLCLGMYEALEERFKAVNEMPLKERTQEPEQQTIFMEMNK